IAEASSRTASGEPFTSTRPRPPAAISRLTLNSSPSPSWSTSTPSASSALAVPDGNWMMASAVILSVPVRIISVDPRAPRRNSSESMSRDFPAPVSPVSTFSPEPGSIANSSTMARLRTFRYVIIRRASLLRSRRLQRRHIGAVRYRVLMAGVSEAAFGSEFAHLMSMKWTISIGIVLLATACSPEAKDKVQQRVQTAQTRVHDAFDAAVPEGQESPDAKQQREKQRFDQQWRELQSFRAQQQAIQQAQAQAQQAAETAEQQIQFAPPGARKERFKGLDANAINRAPVEVPITGDVKGPSVLK